MLSFLRRGHCADLYAYPAAVFAMLPIRSKLVVRDNGRRSEPFALSGGSHARERLGGIPPPAVQTLGHSLRTGMPTPRLRSWRRRPRQHDDLFMRSPLVLFSRCSEICRSTKRRSTDSLCLGARLKTVAISSWQRAKAVSRASSPSTTRCGAAQELRVV